MFSEKGGQGYSREETYQIFSQAEGTMESSHFGTLPDSALYISSFAWF